MVDTIYIPTIRYRSLSMMGLYSAAVAMGLTRGALLLPPSGQTKNSSCHHMPHAKHVSKKCHDVMMQQND